MEQVFLDCVRPTAQPMRDSLDGGAHILRHANLPFKIEPMPKPGFDYRSLSIAERLQLVEEIWDSIAQDADVLPLTPQQTAELDRRWAEHERDPGSATPWEKVRDELHRRGA